MDDLISRQAAIEAVEESRRLNHHQDGKEACAHEYEHRHFLKIIRDLPSVQPERKKGKWRKGVCECGYDWAKDAPISSVPNFCPQCGTDMRGESDE